MKFTNNKILVSGATGVIGRRLVYRLVQEGYIVAGLTTSSKGENYLKNIGVRAYKGSIYDLSFVEEMVRDFNPEIVIHEITDLKNMSGKENSNIRKAGTKNLVQASLKANVQKIISQSISWAYEEGTMPAGEHVPLDIHANEPRKTTIDGIVSLEEATKEIENFIILRYGTLYGKDTWYGENGDIYQSFKNGTAKVSNGVISFIHIDDAVEATIQALSWESGIYNIVDDEPVVGDEWASFYANKINTNVSFEITEKNNWERGASNHKFKSTGGILKYPTWRKGMEYVD